MKYILRSALLLTLSLGSTGFCQETAALTNPEDAQKAPVQASVAQIPVASDSYLIGKEDVLNISVWKEPEISKTVPVRPDGKITLPLLGEIQASGITPRKLQDNITEGLRAYVSNPEVTVIVQEVKSLKFNIVGEIAKPGSYSLTEPMTILDAIAVGGGLKDFAKAGRIYVLRANTDGSHSKINFDYKNVIKGRKLSENVELLPGDTVVVP